MRRVQPTRRTLRHALAALVILSSAALPTSAQPTARLPGVVDWVPAVAAAERTLWLVQIGPQRTLVYGRGVNEPFGVGAALNAPVVRMAAVDEVLYAFVEDGSFYSYGAAGWTPEHNLPQRVLPIDMSGSDSALLAVVPSPPPDVLPCLEAGARPTTSRPFDPGTSPLSVLRYDSRGWVAIAACPADVTATGPPRLHPRLGVARGAVCLFWRPGESQRIRWDRLDAETGQWHEGGSTPALEDLSAFWFASISNVPTLIVARRAVDAGEQLGALRLLGDVADGSAAWRPATLQLSELPTGVRPRRYDAAFGFNQHAVLLMVDAGERAYLRFGRTASAPAEATVAVAEVFEGHRTAQLRSGWLQTVTLVVLFAILLSLFIFRRGAMVTPAGLPPEWAVALTLQRFLGAAIDLVPFLAIASVFTPVDWQAGLRELFGWAVGTDAVAGRLPAGPVLLWWGYGTGSCATYCLVMELLTRRTVGKVIMGTRLLSESGASPGVGAIVVRNLFRFLELQPPLWVLGFLVVLSRNRQRVGDIFARTVLVRRVRIEKPEEPRD